MKKASRNAFFLYMILAPTGELAAQEDTYSELVELYGDEELISIATGSVQPIVKAPAVASIITDRDIEAMGATDLDEALESIPGLHVSYSTLMGAPNYIFRGIYSFYNPQVLMLVNGFPLSNLFHGDRNQWWAGMPIKSIARIEVIRGPGSAVYGADAFAGVINIVTKSYDHIKDNSEVGLSAGSFSSYGAYSLFATKGENYDFAASLEVLSTDGYDKNIAADQQTILDDFFGTNASLAPGPLSNSRDTVELRLEANVDKWKFRFGLQKRSNLGGGAGISEALDPNFRGASDRLNADVTYTHEAITDNIDMQVSLAVFETSQEIETIATLFPAGANLGFGVLPDGLINNPEVWERHSRFKLIFNTDKIDNHNLRTEFGYYFGDIYQVRETKNFGIDPNTGLTLPPGAPLVDVTDTPFVFLPEASRENTYISLQDTWLVASDWEVTGGIRYDDYSDFGNTINPRVAIVWSTSLDLTTKLLYGEAFRAPSVAQLRAINNTVVLGNPNLDPEEMESLELAFEYRIHEKLKSSLNFFKYDWEGIIEFISDGRGNNTAQNIGLQSGAGLEFELRWDPSEQLRVTGNISFQDSDDELTSTKAAFAPRRQFYLSATYKLNDQWKVFSSLNHVAGRSRAAGDARAPVDDYTDAVLTFNYALNESWNTRLIIKNVFDVDKLEPTRPTIPGDLPLAGRNFSFEVSYHPGN